MNLRDLTYLIALAEHRHFGKAAEACFVSQPGLSMQIKKLETTLGIKLIERNNKSVILTESGEAIAIRARQILQEVEDIYEIAKAAQNPYSGELRLGIIPTLAPYLLPYIISPLTKAFPNISFYLIEEQTHLLVEKLKQGKIHVAILALPILEPSFTHHLLFNEEFLLATTPTHPLALKKNIKQQDLADKNLLLLEEGHCMREQALDLCHKMHSHEMEGFRATSLETLRHMVAAGIGITLIPQLAVDQKKEITYIPFSEPKPIRAIGLFWRTTSAKEPLLVDLAKEIKKIMSKIIESRARQQASPS